jgi:hypothetical protein
MGTFVERIQILRDNVGDGKLTGKVEVNQIYAADQHYHEEYRHPDGGKAYYLRDPLYANVAHYMQHLADGLLEHDGKGFSEAMMDNMEHLSREVYREAPWEFAVLRASGHPYVEHNGEVVHDRPPMMPRLTKEQVRDKQKLSRLFDPTRYDR